jgi:hypothetical protein
VDYAVVPNRPSSAPSSVSSALDSRIVLRLVYLSSVLSGVVCVMAMATVGLAALVVLAIHV